jgi:lipopolysaccharide/colanic/teichoic acid biosynthesis glycosyltransferase
MLDRPAPFLYVVGDDAPATWSPVTGGGATLRRAVRACVQLAVAVTAAFLIAQAITGESGWGLAALAVFAGGVATSWLIVATEVLPAAQRLRWLAARLAAGAVVFAMVLAVLGEIGAWDVGPIDALMLSLLPLLAAGVAGLVLRPAEATRRRVLVVGSGVVASHLISSLARARVAHVVGLVDDERLPAREVEGRARPLGGIPDIPRLVREHRIGLVVFTFVGTGDAELSRAVAACRAAGAEVAVVSRLFEGLRGSLRLTRLEGYPVISVGPTRGQRAEAALSRATDLVLASGLMVLTLPLWLALAVAIKVDSRGPVLYRATRVGRAGVPFAMLKFRKMHEDARGGALTVADDERFTRMGRFLARSKLDELPQLWNVVRGQMALVGPRPEDERFVAEQREAYDTVLAVRPGISGLSQICFRREFEHLVGDDIEALYVNELLPLKLAIDRYYVEHRSWATDMRILFWTAVALLRGGELDIDHLSSHLAFRAHERR